MNKNNISFSSFNLYNINVPGISIYSDKDGWSKEQYRKKVNWSGSIIKALKSDVWGFQELWHYQALKEIFQESGLHNNYDLLVPENTKGKQIVCAGAVKKGLLDSEPAWIIKFPEKFRMQSEGDDPQTNAISVEINTFSRPVLHFSVRTDSTVPKIAVYICHFKSKGPTKIHKEHWYAPDKDYYKNHFEALGSALSTIRRTSEAAALRMILTDEMKHNDNPVVVLGDLNDSQLSNTLNVLTGQPKYLTALSKGGGDIDLYTTGSLQEYRSLRDVYYTHIHQDIRESLDHILVSQEFYDNSKKRIWAFDGLCICNDHLNDEDHKETGTSDHGVIKARFKYAPNRSS